MNTVTMAKAMVMLKAYIEADIATMIWGPPGVGKSQGVNGVTKDMGIGFLDFRLSIRDAVDLRGMPAPDLKTGTTRWLSPDELPQVKRDGDRGVICFDEINHAVPAIQNAAFGLILDRKLGEYTLPSGWVPVACGNRSIDRAAVNRMSDPLKNRFAHMTVEPDLDAWTQWASKTSLHPAVIAFVRFRPAYLHVVPGQRAEGVEIPSDACAFPTPRSWATVAKLVDAPQDVRQNLVAGVIGDGIASEFEGFMRIWKGLPSIDQIFKDPTRVHVPGMQEPAALYAVAAALARRATRENFDAAITYASRMPKEFSTLVAVDAIKRDPSLKNTKAFGKWAIDNQDVTL